LFKFLKWKILEAGMGKTGIAGGKPPLYLEDLVTPKGRRGLTEVCIGGKCMLIGGCRNFERETI
jgi:hypothetical protein